MVSKSRQFGLLDSKTVVLESPQAEVTYDAAFVDASTAEAWCEQLLSETNWRQETLTLFGKQVLAPRLSSWVGDEGLSYSYSNMTMQPVPWSGLLLEIKQKVERATDARFNSVLLNYYRDGKDSNGWHADDERELGRNPVIASLSLGAPRDFLMREKANHQNKIKLVLEPGSLLLMKGATQHYWQHQIPKRAHAQPRINLTFRTILST